VILSKKTLIIVTCFVVLIGGVVYGSITMYRHIMTQRELEATMEAERVEQRRIEGAYVRLHYAFLKGGDPGVEGEYVYELHGRFMPFTSVLATRNPYNICFIVYLTLRMYYHQTGIILTYEAITEYFSQEFESDGSLRLYSNDKHPEIESFVRWMWDGRRQPKAIEHFRVAQDRYESYSRRHEDGEFNNQLFAYLSPQMLDALARAIADPDYVLDLTSLQQQGY